MKILHAPSNVANQAWALAHGLRSLGHEAEVWHYGENRFGFPNDRALQYPPEDPADVWRLVNEALERFDVFHFHYARSLVPYQMNAIPGLWDLPLYREARKPVYFTFHGSDVRRRSLHLELDRWSYFRDTDIACDEDDILKRLKIIRTYASDLFVSSPIDLPFVTDAIFHPRAIMLEEYPFVGPVRAKEPLVVHAPSNRNTKGTSHLLRAVEQLRSEGVDFELKLVEGMPVEDVRKLMHDADILVDNLLLGDYGVAGIEAMALGKTVITRQDRIVADTVGTVPVLAADPDTIASVLRRAVRDDGLRRELAPKAREFVEKTHASRKVAEILVRQYQRPPGYFPVSFPEWASLGSARREERLEEVILEMQTKVRSIASQVRRERGTYSRLGARIDVALRKLRRRTR